MSEILGLLFVLFQDTPGFQNLDFELGKPGETPPGWGVRSSSRATLSETDPKEGKYCLVLERKKGDPSKPSFESLGQNVDASRWRGKRLVFRSFIRTEPRYPDNRAQMWVRVDRIGGKKGFFDNMSDRPIRSADWAECTLLAEVDGDAEKIHFGLIQNGKGRVYWDAIRVEVLDPASGPGEGASRPLAGRALENVTAFSRLLGYLRYFYPGDEAVDANWESLAIDGVRSVESAKDSETLARTLEDWSRPFAPAVRVFPTERTAEMKARFSAAKEGARKIIFWHHSGLGAGQAPNIAYRSWRVREEYSPGGQLPENVPDPEDPFLADLGGGVSCLIPLALYEGDSGTLPLAPRSPGSQAASTSEASIRSGNDRATRLADIALAWNVFQHFFPYFDVVKTDWPSVLPESLQSAASDPDEAAFASTLRRMLSKLRDGHVHVTFRKDPIPFVPPLSWDWVEEQLVVTKAHGSAAEQLQPGDVVVEVEGAPARKALEKLEESIAAATPQWARWISLRLLLCGEKGSKISLKIKPWRGEPRELSLVREIGISSSEAQGWSTSDRPAKSSELARGIRYVDLTRIDEPEFEEVLPDLVNAKGVVFDLRGYPGSVTSGILRHLSDKPLQSARWLIPQIRFPDRLRWTFDESQRWTMDPLQPRIRGRIAFLTDGRAISAAETFLGIVEHYKLGEIVGGPTAGTNGNVNSFTLPGGYTVSWTGMKVLKHDGSLHHGVGILPTIHVSKTIRGVTEGKDELLQRAVEFASR